jgi:hypothetical protein
VASRTEEAEVVAYQRFLHSAYAYNMDVTRSDLIEFRPGVGAPTAKRAASAAIASTRAAVRRSRSR